MCVCTAEEEESEDVAAEKYALVTERETDKTAVTELLQRLSASHCHRRVKLVLIFVKIMGN